MPLIEVKADATKNRLYIKLIGLPSHARAGELKNKLVRELAKLKPVFTLLMIHMDCCWNREPFDL